MPVCCHYPKSVKSTACSHMRRPSRLGARAIIDDRPVIGLLLSLIAAARVFFRSRAYGGMRWSSSNPKRWWVGIGLPLFWRWTSQSSRIDSPLGPGEYRSGRTEDPRRLAEARLYPVRANRHPLSLADQAARRRSQEESPTGIGSRCPCERLRKH
jgi:hypothetical protein